MDNSNDILYDENDKAAFKDMCGKALEYYNIDSDEYGAYHVKRGLRNRDGSGVLAGLTNISEVHGYVVSENEKTAIDGRLSYRGYDINDLTENYGINNRYGFEEISYLLLFGKLPTKDELTEFCTFLAHSRELPPSFTEDMILKSPSRDIMNKMARSVLSLYSYDDNPDDCSVENILRQSIQLLARIPMIAAYGYSAKVHYFDNKSLILHQPKSELSIAENLLRMLSKNKQFTEFDAEILDTALMLHAEHGGGNNSTFTVHVVSSSGTDTYSAIAAALGSLKGPKHGGANIKVAMMFDDMKQSVKDWTDEEEVRNYLRKLLHKEAFDNAGLIYGMGHAVYSQSDPRAKVFKGFVEKLSAEKGREDEFALYSLVERLAPEVIAEERRIYKGVCANVDFYSGFVYRMLGIPDELFTPIFATSRIAGWSAHRIEELINSNKIIRPAYKSVSPMREYTDMENRID